MLILVMSSRKLVAVECSKVQIDAEDDDDFRFVVCFVEERWLKRMDAGWLALVSKEQNGEKANELVEEYVVSQSFRHTPEESRGVVVDRMLNEAIAIKYKQMEASENLGRLSATVYEERRREAEEARQRGNPLSTLDLADASLEAAVRTLCALLGVSPHPDPAVSLGAACLFITQNLSRSALERAQVESTFPRLNLKSSFPLGIAQSKEPVVNTAARILRLLCLEHLKEKQILVNETLVHVQDLIAEIANQKQRK